VAEKPISKRSILTSQTSVAAGLVFAALTLCFLMWMATQVKQIQCSQVGLVALVFGLGTALSTSFLGGYAAASGPVTIPYLGNKPINVALGGGILALVITTVMAWLIVGKNCTTDLTEDPFAECKVPTPPLVHVGCVKVAGLLPPPEHDGTLNVRAGPDLVCKRIFSLVNDDVGEVLAKHGDWTYIKKLSGSNSGTGAVEGWVSVSFLTATPCPGSSQ
jgi:hypothetical protein